MPNKNKAALQSWPLSFPSDLTTALLISCFLFVSIAAVAQLQGSNELKVVEASGAVKVRQEERWLSPDVNMMLNLPAVISTGADGSAKLAQKETAISIAANSAIELFEGPAAGQILQRVVQDSGSAFYDVEAGESARFRVETPYLVAVVKGTQFNVTVAAESSTVALYEGQLRIEAPDGSDAVDLHQGQIAKRHRGDSRITVLAMEDGEPVARESLPATGGGATAGSAEAAVDQATADIESDSTLDADSLELTGSGHFTGDGMLDASLDGDVDLGDTSLDSGLDADTDLGEVTVDTSLDSGLDLGDSSLDTGLDTNTDLGDGTLDTSLDSDLALGDTSLDTGLDAGTDVSDGTIDTSLDSNLALGDATSTNLDADTGLVEGDADLGLNTDTSIGDTTVDAELEVDASLEGADADLNADPDAAIL